MPSTPQVALSATGGRNGRTVLLVAALVGLLLSALAGLALGSRKLPPLDVLRVLVAPDGSDTSVIVRELRLPEPSLV